MAKTSPSDNRHKEIFDSIVKQIDEWPQLMHHEHNHLAHNKLQRFKKNHKQKTKIIKDNNNE